MQDPASNPTPMVAGKSPSRAEDRVVESLTPRFVNIAAKSGLQFEYFEDRVPGRYFLPEVMGGGIGWIDFDHDARQDVYLMNGTRLDPSLQSETSEVPLEHHNALFRNRPGEQFSDVVAVASADNTGYGQGCAVGDFDSDGFADLYLCNFGRNVLLANNGDGTFREISDMAGATEERWSSSSVWVDLNSDDLLDLYCVNYMDCTLQNTKVCNYGESVGYCGPGNYSGVPDLVFVNAGDGTFRDATVELGFVNATGKGLAIAVSDFDGDRLPDVYVANDMEANNLFTRTSVTGVSARPEGFLYKDVAAESGCAVSGEGINEASMGIACADYDGDGNVDIYVTHYYQMKNTLYRNLGGLQFEDDSFRTGVASTSFSFLGFGVIPLDVNQDSFPDLFIANGHVLGPTVDPGAMTPQLLMNDGRGNFRDVSRTAGPYFEDLWLGRSAAGADFDNDGDIDLCVSHIDRPVALLRNDTPTGKRVFAIRLAGRNRSPAQCARVTVIDCEASSTQTVNAGGSYLSTSDDRLYFAVAAGTEGIKLHVEWPSGDSETHNSLTPGQWFVAEGRSAYEIPK